MRILFVNFRNNTSSALLRSYDALVKVGISVDIFSHISLVEKPSALKFSRFFRLLHHILFLLDIFVTKFLYGKTNKFFSFNANIFSDILAKYHIHRFKDFDLIHLHWVGHGFMSTSLLMKSNHQKLVITFHDYYFITGGCHVPGECMNYVNVCACCPAKSIYGDFQLHNFNQKRDLFQSKKIFAIAPSKIMACKLKESHLGSFFTDIHIIPNPIDISTYKPDVIKAINNTPFSKIPKNKLCILFVANNLSDHNKGFDLLLLALGILSNPQSLCLVTVGNNMPKLDESHLFTHFHLGEFESAGLMVKMYNLAYMTVVPSRFESFSQVTLESLACGCPVIAFDSSGPSEIISNNNNGLLADSFSYTDLALKMEKLLFDKDLRFNFSVNAREHVIKHYSLESVGILMKSYYMHVKNG